MLGRQMGKIEAGADARQQHFLGRRAGQRAQTAAARFPGGGGEKGVVERRDEGIAVAEAQWRVRGMESMNSATSASNWVPSSATIW